MIERNSPEFDIKRSFAIVVKRKYVALSAALITLSAFTWGSFFWPKTYEASSTVFVEKSSIIEPLIKGVGVSSGIEESLQSLADSISSRNIIERVIKKLDPDSKVMKQNDENLIQVIRKNLKVTLGGPREANLFTISYTGRDPKVVRDLVNSIIGEYIEENQRYRRTDASEAYNFFGDQLMEYKGKLDDSDKAIRQFRERNPHMVPQSETNLIARLEGFQTARIEADIKVKELVRKHDSLQKQLSGEKELTVAFVTKEGSPQERLSYLNNQLVLLMTKYTDSYPEVIKVKSEIEELKKHMTQPKDSRMEQSGSETAAMNPIYQQLKEELVKTDFEIESLRARSAELVRQQQEAQAILGRMPEEQEEWARLQRDRSVYQKIYDDLLQKHESAKVSENLERTNKGETFRVVDPAVLPKFPVTPNRVKMILMGIFFGIASALGAVFGLETIDRSFKDESSIEAQIGLPVLATIPRIITKADILSATKLDRRVFAAAGCYLLVIALVLVGELLYRYMGITIINF